VRVDDSGRAPDFPWRAVIKSEMETWNPVRLPARFQPRDRRLLRSTEGRDGVTGTARHAWRPLALALAVVLAGLLAYSQVPASSNMPGMVRLLLGSHSRDVPASPTLAPPLLSGSGEGDHQAAPSHRTAVPSASAPGATATQAPVAGSSPPASPGPEASSSSNGPLGLPSLVPVTNGATSPAPSPAPTPQRTCLLGIICL
jgi:hypothetical protein